jgi:hypothetical protein
LQLKRSYLGSLSRHKALDVLAENIRELNVVEGRKEGRKEGSKDRCGAVRDCHAGSCGAKPDIRSCPMSAVSDPKYIH